MTHSVMRREEQSHVDAGQTQRHRPRKRDLQLAHFQIRVSGPELRRPAGHFRELFLAVLLQGLPTAVATYYKRAAFLKIIVG